MHFSAFLIWESVYQLLYETFGKALLGIRYTANTTELREVLKTV